MESFFLIMGDLVGTCVLGVGVLVGFARGFGKFYKKVGGFIVRVRRFRYCGL